MHNIAKLLKTKLGNLIKLSHARTSESTQIISLAVNVEFVFRQINKGWKKTGGGDLIAAKVFRCTGLTREFVAESRLFPKSTTASLILS